MPQSNETVKNRIVGLYDMLFNHSGYGTMSVDIKFLKKGQKEVIVSCGKQYRYVVDFDCPHQGESACGEDDYCECGQKEG